MAPETTPIGGELDASTAGIDEPRVGLTSSAAPAATRGSGSWLHLPREFAASILAATTVPISLGATHFPPWAVFVSWAGTFAAGGPKREVIRKIVPTMPLGSVVAMCIVLCFNAAAKTWSGFDFTVAQMVILFVLNSSMIFVARVVPALSFVPGMFFGFASYFATYYGGFGLTKGNALDSLWAVVLMNALGVLYAWLNVKFMREADQHH